ncbi:Phosphorylase b kinase regulatory subunit alpha, skeletal muscle isoform [Actinomortierella wolfii]|nr:Phosphorylase b kinase regulatory subunit alpha, skeletal muscle isoform [Actinomortierella wolfii]
MAERYRHASDRAGDDSNGDSYTEKLDEYGLVYDCPVFERMNDYVEYVAGSTIEAASVLADDLFDVVIHWDGGVEKAFQYSDKVLTISLHHFGKGFFPGTGDGKQDNMPRKPKAVVNLPLEKGLSGERLCHIFENMVEPAVASFGPEAVVLQCGVDGGYKNTSAAKCYAYLTGMVIGKDIAEDIPEHQFFPEYRPDFTLHIEPSQEKDENTDEYLQTVEELVKEQLK